MRGLLGGATTRTLVTATGRSIVVRARDDSQVVASRSRLGQLAIYLVLTVGAIVMVAPFLFMLKTSVGPAGESSAWPPTLLPSSLHPENYSVALQRLDFGRYFINSAVVAIAATTISVVIDSLAGYAFARLRFRGRSTLFVFVIATILIPFQMTLIPLYLLVRQVPLAGGNDIFGQGGIGLLNSIPGLLVPGLATTFGVFLMRQFFLMMPGDLMEAARIDGCSEFKIFRRVYLPLAGPALATIAIFSFTESWNAFLWPLIVAGSGEMRTLQVGLGTLRGQYFTDYQLLMAAVTVTALPPFLVFLFGQKYFVRGVAMSGLKT